MANVIIELNSAKRFTSFALRKKNDILPDNKGIAISKIGIIYIILKIYYASSASSLRSLCTLRLRNTIYRKERKVRKEDAEVINYLQYALYLLLILPH